MLEREISEFQRHRFDEIKREVQENDPVLKRCRLATFLSSSAGRGKKRKVREVSLLVIDEKYAFQVVRGEIKNRKSNNFIEPDMLALELLTDLPYEERNPEILLKRARR